MINKNKKTHNACNDGKDLLIMGLVEILKHFNIHVEPSVYGNGHINDTYIVQSDPKYILQRINKNVFTNPPEMMENIMGVTNFLREKIKAAGGNPDRETLRYMIADDGNPFFVDDDGEYYRAYQYVDGVISCTSVDDPSQLYHAAKAFGKFQNMLADYPAETLHETIVQFHDTRKRFGDFVKAVQENKSGRADICKEDIQFVLDREADCNVVVEAIEKGEIPLRVTHNDTKLNNVLLDAVTGEGVCVIDLDTVMPGSLLYDFGDALRFGGSSGAEDEPDLSKIWFVMENFEAFTKGFLEELVSITDKELELLAFSIKLMTLECGSRFLADFINGDTYFKTKFPEHNLVRARTQFKLVADMEKKMDEMNAIVHKLAGR